MTTKLIQLTDLHLCADAAEALQGINPYKNLQDVVNLLKNNHADADFLLLTGDLSEDGSIQSYYHIGECLAELKMPIYAIAGNHDCPITMKKVFPRFNIRIENEIGINTNWHVLLLDSYVTGEPWGWLTLRELNFLRIKLAQLKEKQIAIFLHHPPLSINSAWMDQYMLKNPESLLKIIENETNIKIVGFGHVHQVFEKFHLNKHFLSAPSTHIQFYPGATERKFDKLTAGYRWFEFDDNNYNTGIVRL